MMVGMWIVVGGLCVIGDSVDVDAGRACKKVLVKNYCFSN